MWTAGYNPVSQRPCEAYVREVVGERPLPTMQLGSITARGIVLARRLQAEDHRLSVREGRVLEVYPRATLRSLAASEHRLRPRERREPQEQFRDRLVAGLYELIEGLEAWPETRQIGHVLDALISAYTAWLWPTSLRAPPTAWPLEEGGWIWFPLSNDQQADEPEVALAYRV
jgi:predicted nuclease with RNAse H fold